jgi:hypothetical protein
MIKKINSVVWSVLFLGVMVNFSPAKAMGFIEYNEAIFKQAQEAKKTIVLPMKSLMKTSV